MDILCFRVAGSLLCQYSGPLDPAGAEIQPRGSTIGVDEWSDLPRIQPRSDIQPRVGDASHLFGGAEPSSQWEGAAKVNSRNENDTRSESGHTGPFGDTRLQELRGRTLPPWRTLPRRWIQTHLAAL